MTKKQAVNYARLCESLSACGVTRSEVDSLIRIERTLQHWAERECGDGSDWAIERDDVTGKPFDVYHGEGQALRYPVADREAGAKRRADVIARAHGLTAYHQGDCRGCMLYILRPGDMTGAADSCYTNGIAVCID